MNNTLDKRIVRTRRYIKEALVELVDELNYGDITVAAIADRAGVARPTFYLHYRTKDDLLLSYLDDIFEEYKSEIDAPFAQDQGKLAAKLFEQVQKNHSFIIRLLNHETSGMVLERLWTYIQEVFEMVAQSNIYPQRELPKHIRQFAVASLAGSTHNLIVEWLKEGMPYPPALMGELMLGLSRPGLLSVLVENSLGESLAQFDRTVD